MIKRILLIDDDRDDAGVFSDAIDELNRNIIVDHFDDGQEALEKLGSGNISQTPDIIFLDINMPALNGWECLKIIRTLPSLKTIPVVMYSTSNLHSEGLTTDETGAAAFITKPNSYRELKDRLEDLLTRF